MFGWAMQGLVCKLYPSPSQNILSALNIREMILLKSGEFLWYEEDNLKRKIEPLHGSTGALLISKPWGDFLLLFPKVSAGENTFCSE